MFDSKIETLLKPYHKAGPQDLLSKEIQFRFFSKGGIENTSAWPST